MFPLIAFYAAVCKQEYINHSDFTQKDAGVGPSFPLLPLICPERTFGILHQRSHGTVCLGEPSVTRSETLSLSLTHINCYHLSKIMLVVKTVGIQVVDRNVPSVQIQDRQL